MQVIDFGVVGVYLVGLVVAGIWLARRAGQSSEHYFLGGRKLPWWALGASGMSSNLDVAGTMTIVTLITLFGLHGFWIEMRGGVVLPIAVFLAFMGKWHRRSQAMTTAEWMLLRFGSGVGGQVARATAALTYVVLTIAMVVFFLAAGGKFLAEFLPFSSGQCALGMALIAFGYTLVGGLYGVIWTDVFQAILIGGAALFVAVTAFGLVTPELIAQWPGAAFNDFMPRMRDAGLGEYEYFGLFLLVWTAKGLLEGLGGSGGSAYMAQRFYAAGSDDDCRRIGMLWTVLFAARWPMVLGFALIAVALGVDVTSLDEAERVLPVVLQSEFFPVGVRGLVLAAMLAAAMSTFDSTINAGASYLVRDVYAVWCPRAGERALVWAGYVASAVIVVVGLALSFVVGSSVLGIWVSIVMLLFPSFLVPFALRWFWARCNGAGFAVGVAGGFASALYFALGDPAGWNEATRFLGISAVSLVATVIGALATRPVDAGTLREFYRQTRPFGWWPRDWKTDDRVEHRRDYVDLVAAVVWQIVTFLLPMAVVLHRWAFVVPGLIVWAALAWWLWPRPATKLAT